MYKFIFDNLSQTVVRLVLKDPLVEKLELLTQDEVSPERSVSSKYSKFLSKLN